MRPLSEDLRRRIIEARQAGAGSVEVSERFRVSRQTVARVFGRFERTGESAPKQIGGWRRTAGRSTGGLAARRTSAWSGLGSVV